MMTINNYQIKTSGVVRESADILFRLEFVWIRCVCVFVCVYLYGAIVLFHSPVVCYLVYYYVTSFFIVSSNDASHREEDRRLASGLPPNSLNCTLIAPRVLADT